MTLLKCTAYAARDIFDSLASSAIDQACSGEFSYCKSDRASRMSASPAMIPVRNW